MIHRVTEYVISCDNWDGTIEGPAGKQTICRNGGGHTYGWNSRKEAITEAPKEGWVRLSRGRWLCKYCAAELLSVETNHKGVTPCVT
jgi:hypothetical protein